MSDRLQFENQLWKEGYKRIMGLDEVGRGCLAGPVVAAGVIFKPGVVIKGIRDSKLLTKNERLDLEKEIKEVALYYVIKEGSLEEIEKMNILWASLATMQKCVEAAGANPDYLLVDGNRYTTSLIPHSCIIKGDDKSQSIAAASILAKNYRDMYMEELGKKYPQFGWAVNVGYPTKQHRKALKECGFTPYHRRGFNLGTTKEFKPANGKY